MRVFIAGCGRSGTSYLKTLISAHPELYIPTETLCLADFLQFSPRFSRRLLRFLFFNEPQIKSWYKGDSFEFCSVRDAIETIHQKTAENRGAIYWGQKTPRFVRYIDLFERHFPDMKWVLIYRDPRAVVLSMRKSKQHSYSVKRACRRWQRDNQPILKFLQQGTPDNVCIVKYEELIANMEEALNKIFTFLSFKTMTLNEVLEAAQVEWFQGSRFVNNQIRDGIKPHRTFVDKWRNVLSLADVALIEHLCADEMDILGYDKTGEKTNLQRISRVDFFRRFKDVAILFEYLYRWPSYLFHTLIRKCLLFFQT